jgi:hypothetical protein
MTGGIVMRQTVFISTTTAILAVLGFCLGITIHGPGIVAWIPAIAGGAGGFGIGCAFLHVVRRWRDRAFRVPGT